MARDPSSYVGILSGTSMDAIDAALIELEPFRLLATHTTPLPSKLRQQLFALIACGSASLEDLGVLDTGLGRLFAKTANELLTKAPTTQVRAIGSHGQTIYHHASGQNSFTLQLGDPNIIAETTGITTVADFRRRDVAAGGQGAPLAPAFHAATLSHNHRNRAVLNIGGMANISFLPTDPEKRVSGFDTGPGNALLDAWVNHHLNTPMDRNGRWAASGQTDPKLLQHLLGDPYFSRPPPKSTGREYFNISWLKRKLNTLGTPPTPVDVEATLCALTATSVALAVRNHAPQTEELLVCGGGVNNKTLMAALQEQLTPCPVRTTTDYGIPAQWVEACTFAWLAQRTLAGLPGNLPAVTGAMHPVILGAVYPASTRANSRA
jgi:anhydro-N-acetylmuramic acid kinase